MTDPSFACRYKEEVSSSQVQRTGQNWTAMCWSQYKTYFMHEDRGDDKLTEAQALKAWMRDIQGFNNVESFKTTVYNRKTGENEERQCVWVNTAIERRKEDETRQTRASTLKNSTKDYSTQQLQEAANKVFSFVLCHWIVGFLQCMLFDLRLKT